MVHVRGRFLRPHAVFQAVRTQRLLAAALVPTYHKAAVYRLAQVQRLLLRDGPVAESCGYFAYSASPLLLG